MLNIINTKVYGLKESLVASGYPMEPTRIDEGEFAKRVNALSDDRIEMGDYYTNEEVDFINSYNDKADARGVKLGTVPSGTGHDNFLKGIVVQFDVIYPQYWTPQFQRYHFADIISSTSKMHCLTKMNVKDMCNEHVDTLLIDNLQNWINLFNNFDKVPSAVKMINGKGTKCIEVGGIADKAGKWMTKQDIFMKVISNTPAGLEQQMRVTSSYLQFKGIYLQRSNHKLSDWWQFCYWCECLPKFVDFCLGGKRKFSNEDGTLNEKYVGVLTQIDVDNIISL